MVRLGGRGYLENLSTEFEKDIRNSLLSMVHCSVTFRANSASRRLKILFAVVLASDGCATLDDIREAVTTLEEVERIARRVFGGAHPITEGIERTLRDARAALRAQEAVPK